MQVALPSETKRLNNLERDKTPFDGALMYDFCDGGSVLMYEKRNESMMHHEWTCVLAFGSCPTCSATFSNIRWWSFCRRSKLCFATICSTGTLVVITRHACCCGHCCAAVVVFSPPRVCFVFVVLSLFMMRAERRTVAGGNGSERCRRIGRNGRTRIYLDRHSSGRIPRAEVVLSAL